MRKAILFLALSWAVSGCSDPDKFVIEGKITGGSSDGNGIAILESRHPALGYLPEDTVQIAQNKFRFEGKTDGPSLYSINLGGKRTSVIIEPGVITAEIHLDSILNTVSGTYHNEELTKFAKNARDIQLKFAERQADNKSESDLARKNNDTATYRKLRREAIDARVKMDDEMIGYNNKYIRENPESFVSVLIVSDYVRRFQNEPDMVEKAYAQLSSSMKNTALGRFVSDELEKMKTVEVGKRAPNFTAPTPEGESVSLYNSLGRVTIVDFWASWCGPCRRENPNMVRLYDEFKSEGLQIVGVSLDKSAEKWKEAIRKDGLQWVHVSHLKEWDDPIAAVYGVEAIPAIYLLDEKGVVVAKNLHGEQLRQKVAELLNKKAPK